ncbi:hypothetical protein [Haliangium ochraceum]|uniref:Lipoprotein n=1 Tax=Haliangium ochraceum (strain DSM 14365 / JCM 11303 / SMP-2) TaxID=502025 RepID=D0LI85_HALO1|nr:hypothetical protein [Haliangium ochraceum]ACY16464.1 hypothetical protein Hoch_3965 [Haliangium ochraceum DSM 14365]
MKRLHHLPVALAALTSLGTVACTNSPTYVDPREALEVGLPDPNDEFSIIESVSTQFTLPVGQESDEERTLREQREQDFGVTVPLVRVDDVDLSIEWTIKNLEEQDGEARILIDGANESFVYVREEFVIDPEEDELPPPLLGNVPIAVPGNGTVSGVFREEQLREAAVDLERITRGAVNPFAAIYTHDGELDEFPGDTGVTVPAAAFGHLVRYDITFIGNRHMILEYEIRARDPLEVLHEELLSAPMADLVAFQPEVFVPPPPLEE